MGVATQSAWGSSLYTHESEEGSMMITSRGIELVDGKAEKVWDGSHRAMRIVVSRKRSF
jgi:hypothetical protein